MGVFIYPCNIKEKVSGLVSSEEMDALHEKYDALKEEIVVLENTSRYDDFVSPFEEGVYTYETESEHADVDISYGTYRDFLQGLENLSDGEDVDCYHSFSTTISASGIDNCISYKVAEEMLEEFKQWEIQAEMTKMMTKTMMMIMENFCGVYINDIWKSYKSVLN